MTAVLVLSDAGALTAAPPALTEAAAAVVVKENWNLDGRAELLTAERDQNFRITAADGSRAILKLANPGEAYAVSNLQTEALIWVARRDPALPVPHPVANRFGNFEVTIRLSDGRQSLARLLSFLEGTPLSRTGVDPESAADIGDALARLDLALADFEHPAAEHGLLWDMRQLQHQRGLARHIADAGERRLVEGMLERFSARGATALGNLPQQAIHNDMNLYNVFGAGGRVTGIVDFGDMVRAPRAVDPAIACAYLMLDADDPFPLARHLLHAYQARFPLSPAERAALPALIAGRHLLTLLITAWRATLYPENAAYVRRNAPQARAGLGRLAALGDAAGELLWREP